MGLTQKSLSPRVTVEKQEWSGTCISPVPHVQRTTTACRWTFGSLSSPRPRRTRLAGPSVFPLIAGPSRASSALRCRQARGGPLLPFLEYPFQRERPNKLGSFIRDHNGIVGGIPRTRNRAQPGLAPADPCLRPSLRDPLQLLDEETRCGCRAHRDSTWPWHRGKTWPRSVVGRRRVLSRSSPSGHLGMPRGRTVLFIGLTGSALVWDVA